MTIGLQGTWNVSVSSKNAAWAQRFTIDGASSGNGTTVVNTGNEEVLVTGDQWGVTAEANPAGPAPWRPSRERLANFRVDSGFFKADIETDDGGGFAGDEDFNDLVLTISKPINTGEWIVYGTAKSYKGFCLFNPCFPFPWIVVDTPLQLERLLRFDETRAILEREYGSGVASFASAEQFRPLMLSRGGQPTGGLQVDGATEVARKGSGKSKKASLDVGAVASVRAARFDATLPNIAVAEQAVLDRLLLRRCEVEPIGQALLRFAEYDRTDAELGGAAYNGFGDRETLGVSATDEFGNYVFSFTRTTGDLITESTGDTPAGGDPITSANPDLLIQFVDDPDGIAVHETAPYYDIPNIRRIDLCIPVAALVPKPCRGDRVLQYLGDIPIINNAGSTLHPDGTITNTAASASGPAITRGAWSGTLDIVGCFEDAQAQVTRYTIQYRVADGAWNYLSVDASGLRSQSDGTWVTESYGPTPTALSVGTVPAYRNIEVETGWSLEAEHRKARINLKSLLAGLPIPVADIRFIIRGYDGGGNFVPGTFDQIRLRVDERPSTGEIDSIVVPGTDAADDCALLVLPSDTSPLDVRLRAWDEDGFLASWSLTAIRGSNTAVGLTDTATATTPSGSYPGDVADVRYYGTPERATADTEGYVTLSVAPAAGGWLGDEEFCAFSFELRVADRTTNGKSVGGSRTVFDEVVGMRAAEA